MSLCVCASVRLCVSSLGHRVVAARMERMAMENALDAEPRASQGAIAFHRFEGVARARRHEATLREHEMRQRQLVSADKRHDSETWPRSEERRVGKGRRT